MLAGTQEGFETRNGKCDRSCRQVFWQERKETERRAVLTEVERNLPDEVLKSWLGGLDSNQDNQIQSLVSYQLNDLPAEGRRAR